LGNAERRTRRVIAEENADQLLNQVALPLVSVAKMPAAIAKKLNRNLSPVER
jgi:hypothetical protein